MAWGRRLTIIVVLWAGSAIAQTLPWPVEPSPQGGAQSAGPPGVRQTVCTLEITRMSEDVEALRAAARTATERKSKREEVCQYLTRMAQAATKLMRYALDNSAACGLNVGVMTQIRDGSERAVGACRQICVLDATAGRLDDVPAQFAAPIRLANSNCGDR